MLIADEMGLGKTLQVYTLSLEFWIIIHHFVMHFISFYIRLNLKLIQHTMFWTLFVYQYMVLVVEVCA